MAMADRNHQADELDTLLAAASRELPELPPALLARVLADAEAELAARAAPRLPMAASRPAAAAGGILADLLALIGGWRAISGLATATIAGVWIGFAGLGTLSVTAADLLGVSSDTLVTVNLLPGDDVFALAMGLEDTE